MILSFEEKWEKLSLSTWMIWEQSTVMRILKGFVRMCSWLVYAIIVVVLMIYSPIALGYHPFIIQSESMLPQYPAGSIAYYREMNHFEDCSVDDAIAFELGSDGSIAIRRVVEIDVKTRSFMIAGGIDNVLDENAVPFAKVLGRTCTFIIPYLGYFLNYVQRIQTVVFMGVVLLIKLLMEMEPENA